MVELDLNFTDVEIEKIILLDEKKVAQLSDLERSVIILFLIKDLDASTIAAILDVSLEIVQQAIQTSRHQLHLNISK